MLSQHDDRLLPPDGVESVKIAQHNFDVLCDRADGTGRRADVKARGVAKLELRMLRVSLRKQSNSLIEKERDALEHGVFTTRGRGGLAAHFVPSRSLSGIPYVSRRGFSAKWRAVV